MSRKVEKHIICREVELRRSGEYWRSNRYFFRPTRDGRHNLQMKGNIYPYHLLYSTDGISRQNYNNSLSISQRISIAWKRAYYSLQAWLTTNKYVLELRKSERYWRSNITLCIFCPSVAIPTHKHKKNASKNNNTEIDGRYLSEYRSYEDQ